MKFKKLILNNFRQYKGMNEIDFSTDDYKNITIIYGDITLGKTTLLQSFNWILYGYVNLQNPDDILNIEVAKATGINEAATVSAELYLEKDYIEDDVKHTTELRFCRSIKYVRNSSGNLVESIKIEKAEQNEADIWIPKDFKDEVNSILPENLSSYFFFDGERFEKLSQEAIDGSEEIGNSMKHILGIEHYTSAISHLTGARTSVTSLLKSEMKSNKVDMDKLRSKADSLRDEEQMILNEISDYKEQIQKLKDLNIKFNQEILDNRDTFLKQTQKDGLKSQIENIKVLRGKKYDEYRYYFKQNHQDLFKFGLKSRIDKLLKGEILNSDDLTGITFMHQQSIDEIIERGYCLCGEKINKDLNDKHYLCLIEERKKLPPESFGTTLARFRSELANFASKKRALSFKEVLNSKYMDITRYNEKIDDCENQINKISIDIQTDVNVGQIEKQVKLNETKIDDYNEKIGKRKQRLEEITGELVGIDKDIIKGAQGEEHNKEVLEMLEYVSHLSGILEKTYKLKEKSLLIKLNEYVNEYLHRLYSEEREIKVSDDYKFKMVYSDDPEREIPAAESQGLGVIKAISLMCGLLEVSKSKLFQEVADEILYPLVFDAPMSNIGKITRRKVMDTLPQVASQTIIFTRETEDLNNISDEARSRINYIYTINKVNERESHITRKEENA